MKMYRDVTSYGLKADFAGLPVPPDSWIGASPVVEGLKFRRKGAINYWYSSGRKRERQREIHVVTNDCVCHIQGGES